MGVICPGITKMAELDFVYTLAFTDINQSALNLIKMYVPVRSRISLIMGSYRQNNLSYLPLN